MGPEMASHYFRGGDDLTSDLPTRADRPARQNWDTMTSGSIVAPLARQRTGDYSWIVSVVPTTAAARNALANNPEGFSYDVSVVVFYKRILPSEPAAMISRHRGRRPPPLPTKGRSERALSPRVSTVASFSWRQH